MINVDRIRIRSAFRVSQPKSLIDITTTGAKSYKTFGADLGTDKHRGLAHGQNFSPKY